MVWKDAEVVFGPPVTEFGWPPPPVTTRSGDAFSAALRLMGVEVGDGIDEFDVIRLGSHRATEDWLPSARK